MITPAAPPEVFEGWLFELAHVIRKEDRPNSQALEILGMAHRTLYLTEAEDREEEKFYVRAHQAPPSLAP